METESNCIARCEWICNRTILRRRGRVTRCALQVVWPYLMLAFRYLSCLKLITCRLHLRQQLAGSALFSWIQLCWVGLSSSSPSPWVLFSTEVKRARRVKTVQSTVYSSRAPISERGHSCEVYGFFLGWAPYVDAWVSKQYGTDDAARFLRSLFDKYLTKVLHVRFVQLQNYIFSVVATG